ncbi:hypothetical protein D3C81_1734480 [compost metagenome]
MQHVHGVDGHGHVGGVLALDQVELLDRLDRMLVQHLHPGFQPRALPVAVGTADGYHPEHRQFGEDRLDLAARRVVGIDEQRYADVLHGPALFLVPVTSA